MAVRHAPNTHQPRANGSQMGVAAVERERVGEIQRRRLLNAMVHTAAERGVANVTVAHVVAQARLSRRTFYDLFEDREDCFLAAFDEAVRQLSLEVLEAYGREVSWRERVRAALTALLEFIECEPGVGRLVIVDSLGAGAAALERRRSVLAQIAAAIYSGRQEPKGAKDLPSLTAEGVVGAVFSVLHGRVTQESTRCLVELVNPLMSMIVLPYLGTAAARKELDRPVLARRASSGRVTGDPIRDLRIRLTYRTVRVLSAVAASPGSSNRTIAEASGVTDQGQMSKLLRRLGHIGLIENVGLGSVRGEANAWRLTERGEAVQLALGTR